MKVTKSRSLVKALTFRIFATLTTVLVFYFFSGKIAIALGAGVVDMIIKILIYYIHERIWDKVDYGRIEKPA